MYARRTYGVCWLLTWRSYDMHGSNIWMQPCSSTFQQCFPFAWPCAWVTLFIACSFHFISFCFVVFCHYHFILVMVRLILGVQLSVCVCVCCSLPNSCLCCSNDLNWSLYCSISLMPSSISMPTAPGPSLKKRCTNIDSWMFVSCTQAYTVTNPS